MSVPTDETVSQQTVALPGEVRRAFTGPAILSFGFRPFFLFGAVWAALAVPVWIAAFVFGDGMLGGLPGVSWHVHEMVFGFLAAIVAGFLLTAVPNWTGRLPVRGWRLGALFGLWLAGRAAMLSMSYLEWVASLVDCAFLTALSAVIAKEVLVGRNWRNAPVAALVTLLALTNLAWHAGLFLPHWQILAQNAAIAVIAILIALIGGRIVPSFTGNWLVKQGDGMRPALYGPFDKLTLAATGAALIAWLIWPDAAVTGFLLLIGGGLHAARLARWRGWRTGSEALVWILHAGYAWLALSFILLGTAILVPSLTTPSSALHALTSGAMGTMVLAVMTRATLGHTGRDLTADRWTVLIYLCVMTGAGLRVAAAFTASDTYVPVLMFSAVLWSGAFAMFALRYGPMLVRPRQAEP